MKLALCPAWAFVALRHVGRGAPEPRTLGLYCTGEGVVFSFMGIDGEWFGTGPEDQNHGQGDT